jgi:hypothetical protein
MIVSFFAIRAVFFQLFITPAFSLSLRCYFARFMLRRDDSGERSCYYFIIFFHYYAPLMTLGWFRAD